MSEPRNHTAPVATGPQPMPGDDGTQSPQGHSPTRGLLRWMIGAGIGLVVAFALWLWFDGRGADPTLAQVSAEQSAGTGAEVRQVALQPGRSLGFDLSNVSIPAAEIRPGGPPKDGIPALTNPRFVSAGEARYLRPTDRVIGVVVGEEARAYPLRILNYHEIVNDRVSEQPLVVTYCPLCDSAAVFDRKTPLGEREFGVSGLLYNSNVLMYDRGGRPEGLWSQVKSEGVSGPAVEKSLQPLPLELTTWQQWQRRHPGTKVLSVRTGHNRDYSRSPYGDYLDSIRLIFPVNPQSDRLPTKERVLGVWTDAGARAYPESVFSRQRTRVEDELDGKTFVVQFDPESRSLRVEKAEEGVNWMYSLWFAWYAFYPETTVFEPHSR